jgi:hypothetical protein
MAIRRQDVAEARDSLAAFARLIGWPMEDWQSGALTLEKRQTVLISPRQAGKSRSLSVLALWWAFRKPGQMILVLSAGDVAASRLLRTMRQAAVHPLLASSVVDETQHRLILDNGSEFRPRLGLPDPGLGSGFAPDRRGRLAAA